jgi:hypothetical protein
MMSWYDFPYYKDQIRHNVVYLSHGNTISCFVDPIKLYPMGSKSIFIVKRVHLVRNIHVPTVRFARNLNSFTGLRWTKGLI